ncbi:MAG TPA: hypothetical protein VF521_11595, partial [Pyrinomonadaceae bacterium]
MREIEFIAQALQLAHGGRDAWLQAPHTLISLGRLADRGLIEERERGELSDAYNFLRTVEHRLQMEQGLQTHTVPEDTRRRALLARRMHFAPEHAAEEFDEALRRHTAAVSRAFARVFDVEDESRREGNSVQAGTDSGVVESQVAKPQTQTLSRSEPPDAAEDLNVRAAALAFAEKLARGGDGPHGTEEVELLLREEAARSLSRRRALLLSARVGASLAKTTGGEGFSTTALRGLVRLCGASEFFGEVLTTSPALIPSVATPAALVLARDQRALLRAAVDGETTFRGELAALRRAWTHLVVEIGARDAAGELALRESNALQTSLAAASINVGLLVARRELARRYGRLAAGPRLAALGLGRLASGGMDYGSDLDLVLVYDEEVPSPIKGLTCEQAYARMVELLVNALSSLTRDGSLYRVDLRLRPDGKNGPLASSSRAFVDYMRGRAGVWEWLAHVKLRAVAGDQEFGRLVEARARAAVHEGAAGTDVSLLAAETRRV